MSEIPDLETQARVLVDSPQFNFSAVPPAALECVKETLIRHLTRQSQEFLRWAQGTIMTVMPYTGLDGNEETSTLEFVIAESRGKHTVLFDGIYRREAKQYVSALPLEIVESFTI